jgi:hypothetical protein
LTIAFRFPAAASSRFHWPMQGPHAFASTVAPISSRTAICPSRRIVSSILSEPGVTRSGTFTRRPARAACRATDAARSMSSYEEFVQEPMSPYVISAG